MKQKPRPEPAPPPVEELFIQLKVLRRHRPSAFDALVLRMVEVGWVARPKAFLPEPARPARRA